ncbi:flagellar filament capping protein FliD [Sphingomonas sp. MMS24-J45]|uniref:flagellar filament capping protein FliD n=1 Tax=Sphingomonas sp. MMS24-J45 TaxID=3238806 RepID=UPI00384CADE8
MVTTSATGTTNLGQSILTAQNVGSGVDTAALISSLVQAQFAAKNAQLAKQDDALTAQISSVAKIQSGITSFASGLKTLVKSGSLVTQPTSSDSSVLTASALPGAKLSGLSASVEVTRLATPQIATTAASFATRTATVGTGTLTLTFGTGTVTDGALTAFTAGSASAIEIPIDSSNQTLDGIAKAINAKAAGVTASVVTDSDGTARLTLKGATGSAQAFTLSGDSEGLAQLNVGVGESATTIGSAALNAQLKVDGVAVERASNTVSDLIDGVKLNLASAAAGKIITLGSSTPTAAITQAVNDFVDTYNQLQALLKPEIDSTTGPLRNDYNATSLARALRGLSLTTLTTGAASGAPTSLSAIGVSTNRDGTLSVNSTKLSAIIASNPDGVEALFADGTGASGGGIAAALDAISTAAVDKTVTVNGRVERIGLVGSAALYTAAKDRIADAEAKVATDTTAYQERLTKQYAASDARVAAYKASQTALTNQIAQWNKSTG